MWRVTLSASTICLALMIASSAGIAAPGITWEVENGFRYFKRASDYREILRIYNSEKSAADPNPTALQLEIALEKAATQDGKFNGIEGNDRRLGWAASIYLHTCARQKDHMHRNCEMEDHESYLEPKGTRIILHVEGVASGNCEWKIDGAVAGTARCNDAENTGPAKPVTTKVSYNEKHSVTVTPSGGAAITGDLTVRDILIVSFGDSFSAGEGNPEKPVNFSNAFSDYTQSSRHGGFPKIVDSFPVRPPGPEFWGDNAANWTNSQCHRSLYSQHTKATLQYSLEHPHVSVTYLNYSCTGAEVYEGILNAWWARDVSKTFWDDAPQMVKALRDLCDDPAADALLLSIGGNDIGFANMIANSAINARISDWRFQGARPWVYGLWRAAAKPQTFATGKEKAKSLIPPHYRALSKQLDAYLDLAPEKSCSRHTRTSAPMRKGTPVRYPTREWTSTAYSA
jgi:hypothetical protein